MALFATRLAGAVFTLWICATTLFLIVHLAPGDPVAALGGEFQSGQTRNAELVRLGLDKSILDRYLVWMTNLMRGELGYSIQFNIPVAQAITQRLPVTLSLVLPAVVLSSLLGTLLALWTARRPGSTLDHSCSVVLLVLYALPVYWVGHLLITFFAVELGWFPVQGIRDLRHPAQGAWSIFVERSRYLSLPLLTLLTQQLALIWLVVRAGLLNARHQPFYTAALARGLSVDSAMRRHALPIASLSLITVIGVRVGALLTSATLVETVFGLPGVGRLLVTASLSRDYPLVLGIVLGAMVFVLIVNAITDSIYAWIDPRIGAQT